MPNADANVKEQLAELQRGLGRIEGKFDAVIAGMTAHEAHSNLIDRRLRAVEQKQYWLAGASALAGGVAGFFARQLGFH